MIAPREKLLAGVFGFLLGAAAMAGLGVLRHHQRGHLNPDRMLQRFTRELALNADQQSAVKSLLEESAAGLQQLHQETQSKLSAIRLSMRSGIRETLNADQQKKFDQMSKRWDARHLHPDAS